MVCELNTYQVVAALAATALASRAVRAVVDRAASE